MALIISVSGLRGLVGSELTVGDAMKIGMIFGRFAAHDGKPFVVASDSRVSSPALRSAVAAGLLAVGADVIDAGIAATPTACLAILTRHAAGGTVVTASHNPVAWNGIKLIGPDGFGLDPVRAERIKQAFGADWPEHAGATDCGGYERDDAVHNVHVDAVLRHCDRKLIETLRLRKPVVVLDSVNGAGALAGTQLLRALGAEVFNINDRPTGRFAHAPEPLPENLTQLAEAVRTRHADIGFAQDPDADRLAIVDETGQPIGEEYTLALAALYMMSVRPGPLAANLSTSRMIDDVAERVGQTVHRTPVGEANVARAILDHHCPIGGEGNGGVIVPDIVPVRDSLTAMALVLQLMAKTGKTVSRLVADLPRYHMVKTKFECPREKAETICQALVPKFADEKTNTSDGLRIDFPADRAWVHIRPSNTEPIIRVIAEAPSPEKTAALIKSLTSAAGV